MSTPDPTRQLLEQATRELRRLRAENQRLAERRGDAIAVVGLACRFPGGAHDPAAFWRLLAAGADLVGEIPPERWPLDPRLAELRGARFAGLLTAPLADFDADFFALSPREATSLDPQQRLLLELACEALDDAGLALDRLQSRAVGVFVGLSNLDYQERVDAQPELDASDVASPRDVPPDLGGDDAPSADASMDAIAVADTGIGLDDGGRHLFDAFYSTKPQGMGLGLMICRTVIEAHGGRVAARANTPRGAVLELVLPTVPPHGVPAHGVSDGPA